MPPDLRPWPFVPRPFPEEAFGSWLGRVASFYRIPVEELAWSIGIESEIAATSAGWLLVAPVQDATIRRIAALARLDPAILENLQTPSKWVIDRKTLPCCYTCLFLNPADVFSPRWLRAWFDPDICEHCPTHNKAMLAMPVGKLRKASGFHTILKAVSRRHQESLRHTSNN